MLWVYIHNTHITAANKHLCDDVVVGWFGRIFVVGERWVLFVCNGKRNIRVLDGTDLSPFLWDQFIGLPCLWVYSFDLFIVLCFLFIILVKFSPEKVMVMMYITTYDLSKSYLSLYWYWYCLPAYVNVRRFLVYGKQIENFLGVLTFAYIYIYNKYSSGFISNRKNHLNFSKFTENIKKDRNRFSNPWLQWRFKWRVDQLTWWYIICDYNQCVFVQSRLFLHCHSYLFWNNSQPLKYYNSNSQLS